MANKGWVIIHRKIEDNFLWEMDKPFDCRSAWIDLLLMANHEDRWIDVNGQPMKVGRGQRFTSIAKLAERWGWTRAKCYRYIKMLKAHGMCNTDRTSCGTLITIEKYDDYQSLRNTDDTTVDTTVDTTPDTTVDTQTMNEEIIRNNEKRKKDDWVRPDTSPDGVPWQ